MSPSDAAPSRQEGSTKRKFSQHSGCSAPSRNKTRSGGYDALNCCLRSVLYHPVGLPLVCYLNGVHGSGKRIHGEEQVAKASVATEGGAEAIGANSIGASAAGDADPVRDHISTLFSEEVSQLVFNRSSTEFNDVFESTYKSWKNDSVTDEKQSTEQIEVAPAIVDGSKVKDKRNEHSFTRTLHSAIEKELEDSAIKKELESKESVVSKKSIVAKHQYPVVHNPLTPKNLSWIDLLLCHSERHEGRDEESIVLIAEFGINCDWWEKADQNTQYVYALRYEKQLSKPTLFAVVTFTTDAEKEFGSARLGVFLCLPVQNSKGQASYRMALLWRTAPRTLQDTSSDFGRTIRAAILLPTLLRSISDFSVRPVHSLGPNCCQIGNEVRHDSVSEGSLSCVCIFVMSCPDLRAHALPGCAGTALI